MHYDVRMDRDDAHTQQFTRFVCRLCGKEGIRHLDASGVARMLEYAARPAGHQDKLSANFGLMADALREANYWSSKDGAEYITSNHIQRALDEKAHRSNLIQKKIQEGIDQGLLLICVKGEEIGQVNGLSVVMLGDYEFGRPNRITATVGAGREGIIDLEREVKMGGPVHSKGVLILSGYICERYSSGKPLTLAACLVFEQSYEGVEGDSASSAELYAVLSALSQAPIKQGVAVTGSVNQHGGVQAVGGINRKIEGF